MLSDPLPNRLDFWFRSITMEILEPGDVPLKRFVGRCNNCRCLIRCLVGETIYDQREDTYMVKCPMDGCPATITVTPEDE